jgi:hypothetical protein
MLQNQRLQAFGYILGSVFSKTGIIFWSGFTFFPGFLLRWLLLLRGAGLFVSPVPGLLLGLPVEGVRDDRRELVLAVLDGLVEVEAPDVGDPVQDLLQPCMYINFLACYSIFRFRALVLMDFLV